MRRIIYDGDSFYELDEDCLRKKEKEERQGGISRQEEKKRQGISRTGEQRRFQ